MAAIIAWLVVYTWKYCDVRGHVGAIGREREAQVCQHSSTVLLVREMARDITLHIWS